MVFFLTVLFTFFIFCRLLRRGMWKDGLGGETPAAYKRRHAENVVQAAKPSSVPNLPAQANAKRS